MTSTTDVTTAVTPSLTPPLDGSMSGLEKDSSISLIVIKIFVLLVVVLVGFLGNILVILVIQRSRRVQSTTNVFVVSLACSDMALILITSPFVCARIIAQAWMPGHVTCRLVRFLQFTAMSSTCFVMVAICADRFYTIIYPLSFKITRGTAKRMVVTAWSIAVLFSSLSVYFFEQTAVRDLNHPGQTKYMCPTFIPALHWSGVLYATLCTAVHYLCPFVVIFFGYFRIFFHIHTLRHSARHSRVCTELNLVPRNKVKIVRMLMTATFLTFLLYLPFYMSQMVYCFSPKSFLNQDVFIACYWFVIASTALKPVVYAVKNNNFWRGCKEVLCMSTMKCYRLNTYTVTMASSVSKRNYVGVVDSSQDHMDRNFDSPLNAFNAWKHKEEPTWPINGSIPTTSL